MTDDLEFLELHTANRHKPDSNVERKLVSLRAERFASRAPVKPRPFAEGSEDGSTYGLPEVKSADLNVARLRDAISGHGALHVRGLLDPGWVERMRSVIDSALEAQHAAFTDRSHKPLSPWFSASDLVTGGDDARSFVRADGGVLVADSPRGMFELFELYYALRIDRLVTEFLGERPALTAEKTTMRRVAPAPSCGGWHQDGQFLGASIRSLNVWIALSDCGVDAPGLELVPKRLRRIVRFGSEALEWTVAPELVEKEFPGALIRPEFKAGDALLFDHFLLHRTWRTSAMTKIRYATESWFFAPSAYPESQTGLFV